MALDVDTIVLAGGLGTRLRGVLPEGQPKAMTLIDGRPFLEILLERLYDQGVRSVILSLGYGAQHVQAFVARHAWPAGLRIQCVTEPGPPLGTGGALRLAFAHARTDPVLGVNGDTFCDADLSRLLSFKRDRRADVAIALARVPDAGRYGAVDTAADGAVTRFSEKGAAGAGLINCGVYAISASVLAALPEGVPLSWERDVLEKRVGKGLFALEAAARFLDIGTPESLKAAASFVKAATQ